MRVTSSTPAGRPANLVAPARSTARSAASCGSVRRHGTGCDRLTVCRRSPAGLGCERHRLRAGPGVCGQPLLRLHAPASCPACSRHGGVLRAQPALASTSQPDLGRQGQQRARDRDGHARAAARRGCAHHGAAPALGRAHVARSRLAYASPHDRRRPAIRERPSGSRGWQRVLARACRRRRADPPAARSRHPLVERGLCRVARAPLAGTPRSGRSQHATRAERALLSSLRLRIDRHVQDGRRGRFSELVHAAARPAARAHMDRSFSYCAGEPSEEAPAAGALRASARRALRRRRHSIASSKSE
jgi:hypothetical protein